MKTAVEQLLEELESFLGSSGKHILFAMETKRFFLDLNLQQIKGAYKHGYMEGAYDVVYEKYDQEEDDNKANNYIQVIYERIKEGEE